MTTETTKISAFVLLTFLVGCKGDEHCHTVYHDTLRHQYFMDCMKAQSQPNINHEDNNGHYVEACDEAAYHQSNELICEIEK